MSIKFFDHQLEAVSKLKTGSILWGGVGSGKSLAAVLYYYTVECKGQFNQTIVSNMKEPKDLYVITTAKKRDTLDWERECAFFGLSRDPDSSVDGVRVTVDSWNNIKKYVDIKKAFFVFDEQRVIGSGAWVRSFLKITKNNNWILLSATPGDTWLDYIPVFVANGFYKNRTHFIKRHVVYNPFVVFPKVDKYLETDLLERIKQDITVEMKYIRPTTTKHEIVVAEFDNTVYDKLLKDRWNFYADRPVRASAELVFLMRRVANSDPSRYIIVKKLLEKHNKLVVFYNFNYELDILRTFKDVEGVVVAEYNGHKHEEIPEANKWLYLVQYMAGNEGWNCVETNATVFYSQNYSYRIMTQAAGRTDRLNTPFAKLYYYHIISQSSIDKAIRKALRQKRNFNESNFCSQDKQRLL